MSVENQNQKNNSLTLRLIMPEWQGGDYELSVSSNDPFTKEKFSNVTGKLNLLQITPILKDVSDNTNVVGFTFAEFMPRDALYLQKMMNQLQIMR